MSLSNKIKDWLNKLFVIGEKNTSEITYQFQFQFIATITTTTTITPKLSQNKHINLQNAEIILMKPSSVHRRSLSRAHAYALALFHFLMSTNEQPRTRTQNRLCMSMVSDRFCHRRFAFKQN